MDFLEAFAAHGVSVDMGWEPNTYKTILVKLYRASGNVDPVEHIQVDGVVHKVKQ